MRTMPISIIASFGIACVTAQAEVFRYHASGNWDNVSMGDSGWGLNPNNPAVLDGSLPGENDDARINFGNNTVTVDSAVPTVGRVQIGVDESGQVVVEDNGVLTANLDVLAGNNNANATGTLTVNAGGVVNVGRILWAAQNQSNGVINLNAGGVINVASHLWLGASGNAEVNISGTLNQTGGILGLGTLNASDASGGTATVNVNDGGLLALNNISSAGGLPSIQTGSVLNINGTGQVTLPGDFVIVIRNYIEAGKITGNLGGSSVLVDLTTNPGFTTVTAGPIIGPNEDPLVVSSISLDPATGEITMTWNSIETETFRILYGVDLLSFERLLASEYDAGPGASTTFSFNRSSLGDAATAGTVFFRVERELP